MSFLSSDIVSFKPEHGSLLRKGAAAGQWGHVVLAIGSVQPVEPAYQECFCEDVGRFEHMFSLHCLESKRSESTLVEERILVGSRGGALFCPGGIGLDTTVSLCDALVPVEIWTQPAL